MGRSRALVRIALTLACLGGCPAPYGEPRDPTAAGALPNEYMLVARIAHITDTHITDSLSPARWPGAASLVRSAWRPQEAYTTQVLDGMVRAVNRMHAAGRTIDLLLHTGDATDNAQTNELRWLLSVMDGGRVMPLSGPDDRPAESRAPPDLDPYAAFDAQGLYEQGRHGPAATIPWYATLGNHDVYAIGVFPIFEQGGRRAAPLLTQYLPFIIMAPALDPLAAVAYGRVTPADPGPPAFNEQPLEIVPNPERAYFRPAGYIAALANARTTPMGHGFNPDDLGTTWYSVAVRPGVRLIGLDTTERAAPRPGWVCSDGWMSRAQLRWLDAELAAADARHETVVVAAHHPTRSFVPDSPVSGADLRAVLAAHPAVIVYLSGHTHTHRVVQLDQYLEIETASTIDAPQEGRVVEVWRNTADGSLAVAYDVFSHVNDDWPPLGPDPLRALRAESLRRALADKRPSETRDELPSLTERYGTPEDRTGVVYLRRAQR
jgi:3',5'-cyclic AMP phosphodiesterase CpdA